MKLAPRPVQAPPLPARAARLRRNNACFPVGPRGLAGVPALSARMLKLAWEGGRVRPNPCDPRQVCGRK